MSEPALPSGTSLADLLDAALATGVAVHGDAVVAVADVPLLHLGLRLVLRGLDGPSPADRLVRPAPGDASDAPAARVPGSPARALAGEDAADRALPSPGTTPDAPLLDATTRRLAELVDDGARGADPADVQRGLAALVLTLVELLRDVLERQAIRRMDAGGLDDPSIERLGRTFQALQQRLDELKEVFGLTDDDLRLDLGRLPRQG